MTIEEEGLENAAPVDLSDEGGMFFSRIQKNLNNLNDEEVGIGLVLRHNPAPGKSPLLAQLALMGCEEAVVYPPRSSQLEEALREVYADIMGGDPEEGTLRTSDPVAALAEMFDSLVTCARVMTNSDEPQVSFFARYWAAWEDCETPGRFTAAIVVDDIDPRYRYQGQESISMCLVGHSPTIIGHAFSQIQHFYEERTALLRKVA